MRLLTIVFIGVIAAGLLQSQAGVQKLELSGTSFQCQGTTISGSYQVTARDENGDSIVTSFLAERRYSTDNGSASQTKSLTTGETITFTIDFPGAPITFGTLEVVAADNPTLTSGLYIFECATGEVITPIFSDGRLNPGLGDLTAVLYRGVDNSGNPAIYVYRVEGTRGIYAGWYDYHLFEPYLNAAPDKNRYLGSVGLTDLYVLTSGEFQINIQDRYEVIFRGIPPLRIYGRERPIPN